MSREAKLHVGVLRLRVHLRFAQTLKDKRQVLKSAEQRIKNMGCSVTEFGFPEDATQSFIGISYVGHEYSQVETILNKAYDLFLSETEVIREDRDIFDYSEKIPQEEDAISRFWD
jgi:uncharacterized protein YlxP (DUF503 family)